MWWLGGSFPPEVTRVADIPSRWVNYEALMRIESNIVRLTESYGNREVESDVSLLLTFRQLESKSGRGAEPEAVKDLR